MAPVSCIYFVEITFAFFLRCSHPQVALVFPNNDPVAFVVAFYGCLLAEVVPVPIEVPLSRKVTHKNIYLMHRLVAAYL